MGVGDFDAPQLHGPPPLHGQRLDAQGPLGHGAQEVGVVADPDGEPILSEPHARPDTGRGLDEGRVDPAVHDPGRLMQVRSDR